MKETDPIVIAMCSDDRGADFMLVAIKSIFVNNKDEDIELHIVTDGFSAENQKNIDAVAAYFNRRIEIHNVSGSEFGDQAGRDDSFAMPRATYFRFYIPEILADKPKVLYLDTDIICAGNISELWATDIAEYAAGVIWDAGGETDWGWHICDELGFPADGYFNAGVMLMNLEYFRQNAVSEQCNRWLAENEKMAIFHDQDALNVVLRGHVKFLPAKFNLQQSFFKSTLAKKDMAKYGVEEARQKPVIIHFTNFKPWSRIGIPRLPYNRNLWEEYRDMSPATKVATRKHDNKLMRRRVFYWLYKLHLTRRVPTFYTNCIGLDRNVK